MSWRSRKNNAFSAVQIVLAFGLAFLPACTFAQQREGVENSFAQLAGQWSGDGTIKMVAGSNEKTRCKAIYVVTSNGTSLEQILHCASDSYKFEVRSKVVSNGTKFAGKWAELTRDRIGNVSGTVTSAGIRGKIDGIGFTADLAILTQANRQSVTIDPTGATDISHVSITMTKS